MMAYLIKTTACALLLYAIYVLLFEKENMHRFKRMYLLGSLVFSMTAPFAVLPVHIPQMSENTVSFYSGWDRFAETADNDPVIMEISAQSGNTESERSVNYFILLLSVYVPVTLLFLSRLWRSCRRMLVRGRKYACMDYHGAKIALINEPSVPHSFGRYIFINRDDYENGRIADEIVVHEWAHVRQRHSWDIVFVELLIAFGWFNPVFYLYRNKIRQNHEFLADDAVIGSNRTLVPAYQTVLIDHIPKNKNINFTSNFNFNFLFTKKRIVMMTREKSKKRAWCKSIALIPVLIAAICVFSTKTIAQSDPNTLPEQEAESVEYPAPDSNRMTTSEKDISQEMPSEVKALPDSATEKVPTRRIVQNDDKLVIAISPVKMNVLYLGVDNPLKIAISNISAEKMSATISQGTLTKVSTGEYIARPATTGVATVKVFAEIDGRRIEQNMDFRVRLLPVPVAKAAGKSGGNVSKEDLLSEKGVRADLGDFLFDIRFVVTQFDMVVMRRAGEITLKSTSAAFTDEQKQLINSLVKRERVFFTNIKARGPVSDVDLSDFSLVIN